MPQDLAVLSLDHIRTEGLMNSPSFKVPIRGSKDPCLRDVDVGVELRRYRKPSSLQWHYPVTAVPMVIVILQEHERRHFDPMQRPELIIYVSLMPPVNIALLGTGPQLIKVGCACDQGTIKRKDINMLFRKPIQFSS
jgi:hypothetical protein